MEWNCPIKKTHVLALLLGGAVHLQECMPVRAAEPFRWIFDLKPNDPMFAVDYGEPESDNVILSFTCSVRSGKVVVHTFATAEGIKVGQKSAIILNGTRPISIPAKGVYSELSGSVELSGETADIQGFVDALLPGSTLTITVPGSTQTIPVTPAGRRAFHLLKKPC
jgi:archaellum component FlaF (FlaF/FlaG flagellin family)